jgi:hypothetical protein
MYFDEITQLFCSVHVILLTMLDQYKPVNSDLLRNKGEWGGRGMWHARERGETCTGFWWESPKDKDHLEDQDVDGRMGSKWTLGRLVGGVWSGFTWLRTGIVGGLLSMRWWTFGFWRHGVIYEMDDRGSISSRGRDCHLRHRHLQASFGPTCRATARRAFPGRRMAVAWNWTLSSVQY